MEPFDLAADLRVVGPAVGGRDAQQVQLGVEGGPAALRGRPVKIAP
ncbi:MAG TPA: hypothetical protein VEV13_06745 [Candidatus Limnocylindria bacterium]|nr:hypothetical protein [Candidatus Limnocylindria bacterium]